MRGAGARSHSRNRTVVTLVFGTLTLAVYRIPLGLRAIIEARIRGSR